MLFNFAFIFINKIPFGKLSLYNSIFPGANVFRSAKRAESYNLSLFNLDAMFASGISLQGHKNA